MKPYTHTPHALRPRLVTITGLLTVAVLCLGLSVAAHAQVCEAPSPKAENDSVPVPFDTLPSTVLVDVTANDVHPEGSPLDPVAAVTILDFPATGTVRMEAGVLLFEPSGTPVDGFERIGYEARWADGTSDRAWVCVGTGCQFPVTEPGGGDGDGGPTPVDAVHDGPFVVSLDGGPVTLDVLANDVGSELSISAVSPATSSIGTMAVQTTGGGDVLVFTPSAPGTEIFNYTATDTFSSDSTTVTVAVAASALEVIDQPDDVFVERHGTAQFSTRVQGGVPPYSFTWIRVESGSFILPSGHSTSTTDDSSTLTYSPAGFEGHYYCEITDDAGRQVTTRTASLVFPSLEVVRLPGDLTLGVGQSGFLEIEVETNASPPSYRWYFEGSAIPLSDPRYTGANSPRLTVVSADASVIGEYTVKVDNELHLERTASVMVVSGQRRVEDSFQTGFGGRTVGGSLDGLQVQIGEGAWSAEDMFFTSRGSVAPSSGLGFANIPFNLLQDLDPGGWMVVELEIDNLDTEGAIAALGILESEDGSVLSLFVEYVGEQGGAGGVVFDVWDVTLSHFDPREGSTDLAHWGISQRIGDPFPGTEEDPENVVVALQLDATDWTVSLGPSDHRSGSSVVAPPWTDYDTVEFATGNLSGLASPEVVRFAARPHESTGPLGAEMFDGFGSGAPGQSLDGATPDVPSPGLTDPTWHATNVVYGDGRIENVVGTQGLASMELLQRSGRNVTVVEAEAVMEDRGWVALELFGVPIKPTDELSIARARFFDSGAVWIETIPGFERLFAGQASSFVPGGANRIRLAYDRLRRTVDVAVNGVTVAEDVSIQVDGSIPPVTSMRVRLTPNLGHNPSARMALNWLTQGTEDTASEYRDWDSFVGTDLLAGTLDGSWLENDVRRWRATTGLFYDRGMISGPGFATIPHSRSQWFNVEGFRIEADLRILDRGWANIGFLTRHGPRAAASALDLMLSSSGEVRLGSRVHGDVSHLIGNLTELLRGGYTFGDWVSVKLDYIPGYNEARVWIDGELVVEGFDLDAWAGTIDFERVGFELRGNDDTSIDNFRFDTLPEPQIVAQDTFTVLDRAGRVAGGSLDGASMEGGPPWTATGTEFGAGVADAPSGGLASSLSFVRSDRSTVYSVDLRIPSSASASGALGLSNQHHLSSGWALGLRVKPASGEASLFGYGSTELNQTKFFFLPVPISRSADDWYRLELVVDGIDQAVAAYVNGVEVLRKTGLDKVVDGAEIELFNGLASRVLVSGDGSGESFSFDDFLIEQFEEPFVNERAPTADPKTVELDGANPVTVTLSGAAVDGGSLTFAIESGPSFGTLSEITPIVPEPKVNRDTGEIFQPPTTEATVDYTPNDGSETADSFVYSVADQDLNSAVATASLVSAVTEPEGPSPPDTIVAHGNSGITPNGEPVTVTLTAEAPEGVALSYALVAGTGPTDGFLGPLVPGSEEPQRTATVEYTPDPGFAGIDTFQFQVCGVVDGASVCDIGDVTVEVQEAEGDSGDLVDDQTISTFAGLPESIDLRGSSAVLDLTFTILTLPTNGTLRDIDGNTIVQVPTPLGTESLVTYQADAEFEGLDGFTFEATDGVEVDTATIELQVSIGTCDDDPRLCTGR